MSDLLSQDQIDALLSSDSFGDAQEGASDSGAQNGGPDYDALRSAMATFGECAVTTLETLISRTITFEPLEAQSADAEVIASTAAAGSIAVKIPWASGLEGEMVVVMSTRAAATLSDLMMMGDGSAEYAEEHRDAIGEIFNQICGSFTTAIGSQLSRSLSMGTVAVQEFDPGNPSPGPDGYDLVTMHLVVEGVDETVLVLISASASPSLMSAAGAGRSDEDGSSISAGEFDDLGGGGQDEFSNTAGGGGTQFVGGSAAAGNIDMLLDVELDVSIELGRADLPVKRVLELAPGSIVELDRLAGEPVDLLVNNKVVAKGEVVVVDENFGIRIVSLVSPEERIQSLR